MYVVLPSSHTQHTLLYTAVCARLFKSSGHSPGVKSSLTTFWGRCLTTKKWMTILLYIQASATISSSVRARQKRVTSRCARPVRDSLCPVCFRARTFIIANTSTRRCHNRQFCNQFFLVKSQSKFYHEHIVRAIVYIILCIHGTCHDVCC